MERAQLVEAAKAKAAAMGWSVIAEDEGGIVTMLLSAEGASDQMVIGPLSRLGAELSALGMPDNYPVVEEYDVIPEPALVEQDGSWTEEAERLARPGELPAGPNGEDSPDVESPPEEAKEVVEMSPSMKELWRALTGQNDDQDRGGIPDPIGKVEDLGLSVAVSSGVFQVRGLHENGKLFASGPYRFVEKAEAGARGAEAAGLKEVRVVRLPA